MSTNNRSKNWLKHLFIVLIMGTILAVATFEIKSIHSISLCYPPGSALLDYIEPADQYIRGWPVRYYLESVPADCEIQDTLDADISSNFYPIAFVFDLMFWTLISSAVFFGYKKLRKKK